MMITIIITTKIIHHSVNMQNFKLLCPCARNNWAYLNYNDGYLNNEECDFKVKIVVGM